MFADAFWPNFVWFAVGQLVACMYLATGRLWRGGSLMLALLVLADVVLVARFGYGEEHVAVGALVLMQAYALGEAVCYAYGRWHRRRPEVLAHRRSEYRAALVAELRGDDAGAANRLARLCRRDPWDVESTVALAGVQRRIGQERRALALLRRARRLDRDGRLRDLIWLESARLEESPAAATGVVARPRTGLGAFTTPSIAASPGPR